MAGFLEGMVCFHNSQQIADYEDLGHAQALVERNDNGRSSLKAKVKFKSKSKFFLFIV